MKTILILIIALFSLTSAADTKFMAITVDDLPANTLSDDPMVWQQINEEILDALTEFGVISTGFVNEKKLYTQGSLNSQRVRLLRLWLENQQELGNHTYQHLDLHKVTVSEFIQDIELGDTVLKRLWEQRKPQDKFFRHPYLHTGRSATDKARVARFLKANDYRIAPVTIDNQEYIFARAYEKAPIKIQAKIQQDYVVYMMKMVDYYEEQADNIVGRSIPQVLLLHANLINAKSLNDLLHAIQGKGYEFVSLRDAMRDSVYLKSDEYYGPAGITWLHRWAIAESMPASVFGSEPEVPKYIVDIYQQ